MSRVFLIDTDTASDDAVALIMALRWPGVEVAAITTVSGNVHVDQGTRNALYTAELCGSAVPVYKGATAPLLRTHEHAHWFHGHDGLSDRGYPAPRREPSVKHAVDAIIETVHANPGLTIVTLGPLTNLAIAISRDPTIAQRTGRLVIMGGAPNCEGNVTPAAEYNIWVDPEAARIVMRSGMPIELVGWQLCRGEAVLNEADIARTLAIDSEVARFAVDCNARAREAFFEQTGERGISLPDPVAMSIALDPGVAIEQSRHYVDIETRSELTRGMTVVDRLNVAKNHRNAEVWADLIAAQPNASVCWTIDVARWKESLFQALSRSR